MHGWLQDKLTQRVGGCTCADGEVGCTDVIAHEAVFTCSVTIHGCMLDCLSDRVGIGDEHYRVQAVIAMTCRCVAFALPCCSCLALLVWKVDGPLPTQIHPSHPTCRLGMKRVRLRNRYSIPHCGPATTTATVPTCCIPHFHSSSTRDSHRLCC